MTVVGFHAYPELIKGGSVGVDIFFVISGFLICRIIVSGMQHSVFRFCNFHARRIERIFPALIVVLATTFAVGWFALLADEYEQ